MYPFPTLMGGPRFMGPPNLPGPVPMSAMGLGAAQQQQKQVTAVIGGVSGWGHIGLGAVAGLAAGYFVFKR